MGPFGVAPRFLESSSSITIAVEAGIVAGSKDCHLCPASRTKDSQGLTELRRFDNRVLIPGKIGQQSACLLGSQQAIRTQ